MNRRTLALPIAILVAVLLLLLLNRCTGDTSAAGPSAPGSTAVTWDGLFPRDAADLR